MRDPACDVTTDQPGNRGMESKHQKAYLLRMATMGFRQQHVPGRRPETAAEQRGRVEREEAIIAKAEADIHAGLGIEADEVEAWLNTLDHDPDAPLPSPDRRPALR